MSTRAGFNKLMCCATAEHLRHLGFVGRMALVFCLDVSVPPTVAVQGAGCCRGSCSVSGLHCLILAGQSPPTCRVLPILLLKQRKLCLGKPSRPCGAACPAPPLEIWLTCRAWEIGVLGQQRCLSVQRRGSIPLILPRLRLPERQCRQMCHSFPGPKLLFGAMVLQTEMTSNPARSVGLAMATSDEEKLGLILVNVFLDV